MAGEWTEMRLGDAILINPPVRLQRSAIYPFVDMPSLDPNSRSVSARDERAFSGGGSRFAPGDTLFARITPCLENGKICRYLPTDPADDRLAHGSTEFIVLRGRAGVTDDEFVFYLARSPAFREYAIAQMTGTTGRQRVPTDALAEYGCLLPPLDEQRSIASVLSKLDDAIQLNVRIVDGLDAILRRLYVSWFVDFDPVGLNTTDGSGPSNSPKAIFPEQLTDSSLGPIPEGWRVEELGDVVSVVEVGGRPKGGVSAYTEGVPSVGAESIVRLGYFDYSKIKFVPTDFYAQMRRGHVASRDVLLYKDGGRPGEFEPHATLVGDGFPFESFAINEHVYRIRVDESKLNQTYLYYWLTSDIAMTDMRNRGTGVAIPGLNSTQVKALAVLVPSEPVIQEFQRLSEPLVSEIFSRCSQSRQTAVLRDALLPEVIEGRLQVPAAEHLLVDVGVMD